jgi:hypothetical protein
VIPPEKPLYVFASHFHQDHFSAGIFDLALKYQDVTFILSSDIKEHGRLERNISQNDAKTNWDEEQWLEVLLNGQPDEEGAHSNHDDVGPLHVGKTRVSKEVSELCPYEIHSGYTFE